MLTYWLLLAAFAAAALTHRAKGTPAGSAMVGMTSNEHARPGKSFVLSLTTILLIVLVGLRYRVGGDWFNYLRDYRRIGQQDLFASVFGAPSEVAYTVLNWTAAQLDAGIWLVNMGCAIPFALGLMRLCRQQLNPWLALVVATPILIIVVGMGFTRQAVALGFLLLGLSKITEKRSIRGFVILVLAGALFHRTVLIFIPIVLASLAKNRIIAYSLTALAFLIGYFTLFTTFFSRYSLGYLQAELDAAGATMRVAMNVVPAVFLIFSEKKFFENGTEERIWKIFAILSIAAAVSLTFVASSAIIDRLALYLIPMQVVVLSRFPYVFSRDENSVLFWRTFVVVYSIVVLFVWLNYATYAPAWIPYRNYLF